MPEIDKVYLDSNLLVDFYLRSMSKTKPFKQPEIIEFLSSKKELPKFISAFSLAEIGARVKRDYPDFTADHLMEFTKALIRTINFRVIEDIQINWKNVLGYALLCKDVRNSIHIDIARGEDLWFITRDTDDPRVKPLYHKVIGESKFKKQFR